MTQKYSRWWAVCGLFTLLVLSTGCDPCMNNPCDNGLACDGEEICTADGGQAVCTDGTPVSCDFPTFCTEPDGACVDPCEGADCSDDNDCTTDSCTTHPDSTTTCDNDTSCDDGEACTEGDTCDDAGECAGTAIECATGEVCADGVCVCADDSACDDGDRCTGVETCDVETGDCVAGTPVDCDDGVFCNGAETCEPDAETGDPTCVDGIDPCAEGETCDEETDECLRSCNNDTECDDGNLCNGEEFCDSATGMCVEGVVLDCGDGDPCTDLTCDESAGCMFIPTVCAEGETCDPVTGECSGGDETLVEVDVLILGNFHYPTGLFFCGAAESLQDPPMSCPNGAGCEENHWHSGTVRAISAIMDDGQAVVNEIVDPNPCFCGHGKVSEVTRTSIGIEQSVLDEYLSVTSLDELPAPEDCSP